MPGAKRCTSTSPARRVAGVPASFGASFAASRPASHEPDRKTRCATPRSVSVPYSCDGFPSVSTAIEMRVRPRSNSAASCTSCPAPVPRQPPLKKVLKPAASE